ncbi:MAG TPA: DUF4440 domain-containing protein [Gemmatimonadaceae bacterium]|nr:DUF4440 domain-containing protein [Gemmatimonadaceae bacterium]
MHTMRSLSCALILAAAACAPAKVDTAAATQALLKRDADWSALAAAGKNADSIAAYWTTDAVLIPTGQPVIEGREALAKYVAENLKMPGFKIQWTPGKAEVSPDGKMGYIRETTTVSVPGAQGAPVVMTMHGVTVWRIDTDGQWRCVVDIMNEAPPAK